MDVTKLQKALEIYTKCQDKDEADAKIMLILKFGSIRDAYIYWQSVPHDSKLHDFTFADMKVMGDWSKIKRDKFI